MLLRKITLNKIRSYKEDTVIEIPGGTILFQGDIGCGKSTILSAIEFALFGLGDIDGNNLLRSGEKKGSVLLEFQVNNKNYQILRRAFNIEEYSTVRKNAEIVLGWSNNEIRVSSEITKDLQERETLLYELDKKVTFLRMEVEKGEVNISELDKQTKELKANIDGLKPMEVLVLQLQLSIP